MITQPAPDIISLAAPFQSPLFRCPTEVIIRILLLLPLHDLLAVSESCKKLRSIYRDSIELRYREELLVAGCRDRGLTEGFSPHETPLSTRLSILEAQQARWKSLNWVDVSDWPLTDGCPIYELYGGTFAQIWDNYIHESGKRRSNLNVVHLPSESRGIKNLQKIAHESLGYGVVVELGIDPEQDLVMLIHQISLAEDSQRSPLRDKFVIDFLTMNTHGHHPASCGIIEYEPVHTSSDGRYRITPLIMGDLLGIMFNAMDGSPATLTIWRWTSGKQLLCLETPRPALWFSFLSETTFVVPCMDRDVMTATLHIYRIPDEVLDPANDARHTDPSPVILNPLPEAEYLLPPFNDKSITGYSLVCRSHPLPAPRAYVPPRPTRANPNSEGVQTTAQPAPAEPSVPDPPTFQVDPDERIMTFSFIFNVYYDDSMGHGIVAWQESYVLATHVSTLLSHTKLPAEETPSLPLDALLDLEALPFSLEPVNPPIIVPWSAWADRARWLGDRTRRNWYSHTYGHRFVRPTWRQSEDHNDPFSIQVIDFNPYNIRRQAQRESEFEAWRKQQHPNSPGEADKQALTSSPLDPDLPGTSTIETAAEAVDLASRIDAPLPEPEPSRPRIVSGPSVIQGHVFTEPVKTSLPYMEVTSSEILYDFEGLMICEEHVLRLKRRSTSTSEIVLEIYSI